MIAATALLWGVVVWRVVLTLARGWASWRGTLTVGMLCLAVMVTGIVWRGPVDAFIGVPNMAGLLARVAVVMGILTGHLTLIPTSSRARAWMIGEAAAAILIVSVAWALAPLHGAEVLDLRPLSTTSLPVAIYTAGVDLHLGVAGTLLTFGLGSGSRRSAAAGDKVAAFTLGLGALGTALGVFASILLLLQIGYIGLGYEEPSWLSTSAVNAVVGLTGATLAAALLLFPVGEWVQAHRRVLGVTPDWRAAIATHPEVHLAQSTWTRVLRPQLVLHRRRIELEDAATR